MRSVNRSVVEAALLTPTLNKMSDNIDLGVSFAPFLPCEEPTAVKQINKSHLGTATACTGWNDLCTARSTHLKVVPDFILQESRVFLQSPSELRNTGVDLQQLHRVALVVPGRGYVLEHTGSPHTCRHYGLRTEKQRGDGSDKLTEANDRPKFVDWCFI